MSQLKQVWISQETVSDSFVESIINIDSGTVCKIATNKITNNKIFVIRLYSNFDLKRFEKKEFQGVSIELLIYPEYKELTFILLDNELEEIFYLFIENLFENIKALENEDQVIVDTSNTISKWKRLFDKIRPNLLTEEQQKGLMGELLFIIQLIKNGMPIPVSINNWFGPDFFNKDFIIENIGFEIKTTSQDRPVIKISSEQQLDNQDLKSLFLVQFVLEERKNTGNSLPEIINNLREILKNEYAEKLIFENSLLKTGYNDNDASRYTKQYEVIEVVIYNVEDDFPKITKSILPKGVFNSIYNLEVPFLEKFKINNPNILSLIYG